VDIHKELKNATIMILLIRYAIQLNISIHMRREEAAELKNMFDSVSDMIGKLFSSNQLDDDRRVVEMLSGKCLIRFNKEQEGNANVDTINMNRMSLELYTGILQDCRYHNVHVVLKQVQVGTVWGSSKPSTVFLLYLAFVTADHPAVLQAVLDTT
jgi:hypothetical protein